MLKVRVRLSVAELLRQQENVDHRSLFVVFFVVADHFFFDSVPLDVEVSNHEEEKDIAHARFDQSEGLGKFLILENVHSSAIIDAPHLLSKGILCRVRKTLSQAGSRLAP